jgi:hypothetical protein
MALFGLFSTPRPPSGLPDWDGLAFALDDPRVPQSIAARARANFGDYPLFYLHTPEGGEWWLMDDDNLLEAYWLE